MVSPSWSSMFCFIDPASRSRILARRISAPFSGWASTVSETSAAIAMARGTDSAEIFFIALEPVSHGSADPKAVVRVRDDGVGVARPVGDAEADARLVFQAVAKIDAVGVGRVDARG